MELRFASPFFLFCFLMCYAQGKHQLACFVFVRGEAPTLFGDYQLLLSVMKWDGNGTDLVVKSADESCCWWAAALLKTGWYVHLLTRLSEIWRNCQPEWKPSTSTRVPT